MTLPAITGALRAEDYGAWVLAYAYGTFVTSIANFGMPVIYERNYFDDYVASTPGGLLWTTIGFVVALLVVGTALTWVFRVALSTIVIRSPAYGMLLFWTTCAVGVGSIKTYFLMYLRNAREARAFAWFSVNESLIAAALTVVLVAVVHVGPLGLAFGPLAASIVVLFVLSLRFARRLRPVFDRPALQHSLRLSLPLLPRILLGVLATQFDKWTVGLIGTPAAVAAYAIGQRLAYVVFTTATTLENVFQPRTYSLMFQLGASGSADVGRMLTPYAFATVAVALAVCLAAEEFLAVLMPASYGSAVAITAVLSLRYALLFFGKQPQLLYARRTELTSTISVISLALSVAAVWVGAHWFGALGAALGTLAAGAVSTWAFTAVGQRFYRIGYERGILRMAFWFLGAAVLLVSVLHGAGEPYMLRLAVKLALAAGFIALGWRTGMFPRIAAATHRIRTADA